MSASSDGEGEAHKGHECSAWCVFQSWVSEIRGGAPNTDDLGLRSAFDAIAAEARDDAVPAVEAEMSVCAICRREPGQHGHTGREAATHTFVPAPETVEMQEQAEAQVEFDALWKAREPEGAYSDFDYKRFAVEANLQIGLKPIGRLRALQALIEYEAAIRAPLEEQIRELEAQLNDAFDSGFRALEASVGLRAENAKLREALERIELNSPVNSFAYKKAQEALATSSTEATE